MNNSLFSSRSNEWGTPQAFFNRLDAEFGFTLDPCATDENAKCKKYYTIEDDGLSKDWGGETVFCNPPYGSAIAEWVRKSFEESKKSETEVVMLIPARTDTRYWHDYIFPNAYEIRFIKGRLSFEAEEGSGTTAPFPSAVIVFDSMKCTMAGQRISVMERADTVEREIINPSKEAAR